MTAKTKEAEGFMLRTWVGKTKRLYEDGLSTVEIAAKLKKPESTVREWVELIKKAERYKAEMKTE